jgi:hypothetical protein
MAKGKAILPFLSVEGGFDKSREWGARYAPLRDPYSYVLALNAQLQKKDPEKHEDKAARSSRL